MAKSKPTTLRKPNLVAGFDPQFGGMVRITKGTKFPGPNDGVFVFDGRGSGIVCVYRVWNTHGSGIKLPVVFGTTTATTVNVAEGDAIDVGGVWIMIKPEPTNDDLLCYYQFIACH